MDVLFKADGDLIIWIVVIAASLVGQGIKNYRETASRRRKVKELADARKATAPERGEPEAEPAPARTLTPTATIPPTPPPRESPRRELEDFLKSLLEQQGIPTSETGDDEDATSDTPPSPPPPPPRPTYRPASPTPTGEPAPFRLNHPRTKPLSHRPAVIGIAPLQHRPTTTLDPYTGEAMQDVDQNRQRHLTALTKAIHQDLQGSARLQKSFLLKEILGRPIALQDAGSEPHRRS